MTEPHQHRRAGDPEGEYVTTERRVQEVIDRTASKYWRLGVLLMPVVCTIFLAGGAWIKFRDLPSTVDKLANGFATMNKVLMEYVKKTDLNTQAIAAKDNEIRDLRGQIANLQPLATASTEQKSEAKALTDRVSKLENFQTTQEQAYNFNFTTRLARTEATLGISQLPSPPKK